MTTTIKNYNLSKLTGLTDSNNILSNVSINNSIIIPKSAENTNTNSDNANAGFYIKDVNSNGSGDFYNIKVNSEPSSIPALYFNNNEVLDRTNVLSTLESILEDYTLDTSNLMVTNGYINFANGSTPNTNQGNTGVGIRYSSANTVQFKNYDTNWIDLVDIINHDEFKELVDVDVTTNPLLDNQYITYNSGTAKFVNSNLSISHDANPTLSGDLTIGDYLLQFGDTYNRLVYNSEGIIDNNLIVLKNNSTLTNNYSYLEINNADISGIINPSIIVKSTYTDSNVGIELTTLNAGDINLNATTGNVNVNATHLVVSGDLIVQGTTTTIDSIITVYKDPVIQIGGSNVLVSNDGKDRGVSFKYYDGGDKTGFMGYDNDTGNFIFKKNATITNDVVVSGTNAGITFGALTSTGDLEVTGTITGDTSLTLDTTTITTAEIGVLDGVTPGTATASKALVLDSSSNISGINSLTISGVFTDGNYTFDTSGNVSGLGTVGCGVLTAATGSTVGNLTLADGSITSSSAAITFGAENLSTTGTLGCGVLTAATGSTIGDLTLADGSITSSSAAITFGAENLSTTGTLGCGVLTAATGSTIGDLTLADGSITSSSAAITFGAENLSTTGTLGCGVLTTTSGASGTDALVITAGDILVSSGHIDMTVGDMTLVDGSVSITDADNATSLSIINNTITTADALVDISSTSLTTGAMMRINANTAAHDGEILELINAGDATSTGTGLSVTMPNITTGAATGINVTMVGATTTAKGISVTMDAITTGDMLYLDNGGATMTGDGKFINCNDDDTSQFSVAVNGATTIAGSAAGTAALTLTTGDIVVSDGGISVAAQSVIPNNNDGAASIIDTNATAITVAAVTTNSDDYILLPAASALQFGHSITICCNAGTNFELRTAVGTSDTINNVDCSDGANEYLCTDTDVIIITKHLTAGFIGVSYTNLGAVRTPVVPD